MPPKKPHAPVVAATLTLAMPDLQVQIYPTTRGRPDVPPYVGLRAPGLVLTIGGLAEVDRLLQRLQAARAKLVGVLPPAPAP